MKLITRDTDYAIRALCYIARHGEETVTVEELVGNLKMPRPFLRKILQVLNKKGILRSYKGRDGGFNLIIAPEKIFLPDLIEIFQGPLRFNEHLLKNNPCPHRKTCKLKKKLDKIEGYIIKELKNINLETLL